MMVIFSLAFLVGVLLVQQLLTLPGLLEISIVLLLALICLKRQAWGLTALLLGWLWAVGFALVYQQQSAFAPSFNGREVRIQGTIVSLPQVDERRVRFDFVLHEPAPGLPAKVKLIWYHPSVVLRAGQQWAFWVKLKEPHGLLNPGGFDYERWLFTQGTGATGYIRQTESAEKLADSPPWPNVQVLRQIISERLSAVPQLQWLGFFKALTIGKTDEITKVQWRVLRNTGTVHLVAISGSHITLLAGWAYFIVLRLWVRVPTLRYAPPKVAAIAALLTALFYAMLAGFAPPVQRALVMLSVLMLGIFWQRQVTAKQSLALALLAVLLWDPFAVLSPGFWLSFVAVALIFYIMQARLGKPRLWRAILTLHTLLALAMLPLLIDLFQQVSFIAPIANFIAVPVINLLLVPLALIGVLLLVLWPSLAVGLFAFLEQCMGLLWQCLSWLAALPWASISGVNFPPLVLLLATIGMLVLFMPRGLPGRYLGLLLCLPLVLTKAERPSLGDVRMTVLDVGQGLAVVVQTHAHVLVYDTGLKFSEQSDSGQSVLLPFLGYQSIRQVDALVVSHGDSDHSGGAESLLLDYSPEYFYTSVPERFAQYQAQRCVQGQAWVWDEVSFEVLGPPLAGFAQENDNSCVLKISTAQQSILLTGDIEQSAEQWLLDNYAQQLAATVLVAPHHGSDTSSTVAFLQQVSPKLIVIPAGFNNQFHFPHAAVLARYQQQHLPWLNVAEQGAISINLKQSAMYFSNARKTFANYWRK